MATKAELESERQRCHAIALRAIAAERAFEYGHAIGIALESLPHLDAAMQFEKRYLKIENPPVPSVEVIFRCAPPLFRYDALDVVDQFLDRQKKVEKNAAVDLRSELAATRSRMVLANRMWAEIENGQYDAEADRRHPAADENEIRNAWDRLGLLEAAHAGGRSVWLFRTRLDEDVQARCFNCGRRVQGRKLRFLEVGKCPRCETVAHFAILDRPVKEQRP
ncbi:hypothetical protein [Limnoglobus roseus]|uniref:Uncharacterized protein n=1 Tax=Limnoglobus roseus TaxID=2598579 RepID=A0A5C1AJK2_9BACT|nr:hypothetical protein [Limnoglobus roseus]QEL18855.1 hypothetical protein PX52LOC_05896 [Limnoglobus roseus]